MVIGVLCIVDRSLQKLMGGGIVDYQYFIQILK